jgi:hypothetical protein
MSSPAFGARWMLERHLAQRHQSTTSFDLPGFCTTCNAAVDFISNFDHAWTSPEGLVVPNWRDFLRCPRCKLNGRQRHVAQLAAEWLSARRGHSDPAVYMMESVTPLFRWMRAAFPSIRLTGSEFMGPEHAGGALVNGIRNEDAEQLSFADSSIDLFISCDVYEHINSPEKGFAEISRTLRPGGQAILTFPMDPSLEMNCRRAELTRDGVRHTMPAVYHGNPLSRSGSLVFTDFGWEVLEQMTAAGLNMPTLNVYWAYEYGYLGIQFYFLAAKE